MSGVSIDDLMAGANDARKDFANPKLEENQAYYVAARNVLHRKGKNLN